MLEAAAIYDGVRALEESVVPERSVTKDGDLRRNEFPQPREGSIPPCRCKAGGRIKSETNPLTRDLSAVDRKSADIERHVGQIVVVASLKVVDAGRWIHASRHAPGRLGTNADSRRPVESPSHRVEKEICSVEEREVGRGPRDSAIYGIGEIVERQAHSSRCT